MNEKLLKMIDSSDVISFDVFDTLVYRKTYDIKDIFRKTAIQLGMSVPSYVPSRSKAEGIAMQENGGRPVKIEKIFEHVDLQGHSAKELIETEKTIEFENLYRNDEIFEIYQYCMKKNKTVIITSDMYLHKEMITDLLHQKGYEGFSSVFVSSEYGKSKYKGDLFDEVKQKYAGKKIFHIGDAKRSDWLNAKMHGLSAYRYKADYGRCKYYRFGYEKLGPSFSNFGKWLHTKLNQKSYDHIFFLSREGLFLKNIYEAYQKEKSGTYLYVSRRSLTVPLLSQSNAFEILEEVVVFSSAFDAKTFLSRLGLKKSAEEIEQKTGVFSGTIFYKNGYRENADLHHIYETYYDEILENAKKEWENLIAYLKENKFEGKVAIVDIGWNGTMQNALQRIIEKAQLPVSAMDGYYLGVASENIKKYKAYGFLYEHQKEENYVKVAASYGLFELLTLAHHGSVRCYEKTAQNMEPVLYEYDGKDAYEEQLEKIDAVQEGILDFISYGPSKKENKKEFWDLFINPDKKTLPMLAELPFFDADFKKLVEHETLGFYISHPKKFKEDFYLSVWKIGFLKSVFQKNLPYYKLYEMMKNRMG